MWGFSGTCAQYLYQHYEIDPLFITWVRMLGSGILFLILLAFTQRGKLRAIAGDRRELGRLALFGIAGLFVCQFTYTTSVNATNAGTATVLQSLNTVFILAATCLIMRRAPRAMELGGLALALVATWLIATKGNLTALMIPPAGLAWGLINASSCTFYIMYPKHLFARWGSLPVTGIGMLIGGIAAVAIWGLGGLWGAAPVVPELGLDGVLVLAAIVVVGTLAAFGLYLHGVSIVGSVKGGLLGTTEPASAMVFAALWLGTMFTWADWIGLVLMVAMIFLVTLSGSKEAGDR
ncbi:MAG TPA: EamA family transporter [Candidatus Aphodovivens avicola]|nr:EamA family transporter [Candidatus Aphodovivens avicola]